jgi:hypothetical protein
MLWCEDALLAVKTRNMRFHRGTGAFAAAPFLMLTCASLLIGKRREVASQKIHVTEYHVNVS